MMLRRLAVSWVLASCGGAESAPGPTPQSSDSSPTVAAPTPVVDPSACEGAEREGGALHWFRDDYPRALACARSKSVPLMIDMWAPWCHTCLSMQAYVLTDERFADYDRRFVFLALDTDREGNAAPVAAFPPAAWPTFFVVSPIDESIQSRFVGGGSVDQIAGFLDDGERGHQALQGGTLAIHEAAAREGDRAASKQDWQAARKAYAEALASAPVGWSRAPDTMVSLVAAHARDKAWPECTAVAEQWMAKTGSSASATDFAAHAMSCAEAHPDAAAAKALRERVADRLTALLGDTTAELSVDDRSDALMYLREALDALGRKDEAKAAAERQRALLDAAAREAEPREAMMYNWPRAEVYGYLDREAELVPALEQSVKDMPKEYDPPYRLAWLLLEAGKPDDARA
ncbi:MAG: thioredoxin family protein, partial [Deltaproteobacteria bacterium]|nr:thioredoxin family protein [Nannocystaceae bacterium]